MTIRIDRIKVNRGGPLESDFDFEPGDLNLIYGRNETGKTYVVESLIRFLFKTSGRTPVDWDLRDWDVAGSAIVSGLENDPVSFTKTSKKLEDYWEDGTGLPRDLSRLLVILAGETLLAEAADGVGRDMLKDYLSGEGLLDKVAARISRTLQRATIQDHVIEGDRRGELSTLDDRKSRLATLQILLDNVEEGYASGDVYSLRQSKSELDARVETLEKAKRYHAAQLAERLRELNRQERELPTRVELAQLESEVTACESNKIDIVTKSQELEELESTSEDFRWAGKALGVYEDVTSGAAGSGPKQVFMILALLSLAGTVTFGLLEFPKIFFASAVLFVLFVVVTYLDMKKALSSAGESTELEKLAAEYRSRFGSELSDRATIQAKLEELKKNEILATPLREALDTISGETRTLERRLTEQLTAWNGVEVSEPEWRNVIRYLDGQIGVLEDQIDSIGQELTSLGVPDNAYLDEDPGEAWASERYDALVQELRAKGETLGQLEERLETLKVRVSQATGLESSDWEELITALRDKREEAAHEYRQLTAEVLAKIQVNMVIQEFRQEENSRIAEGLKRKELTETLHALTDRYRSIRLDDDEGLVLISDRDEEYPLASMSTGAREQTFLALRMGFASIAMEGKTGFLILDDAFQHSDWNRRENLVTRTLSFVRSGWQVLYFTMDDHIRDLFRDAGDKIGDRFRSHELG
ncbi:MAG: hypothetical protein E2P01_08345 [Acidobacteria bacterium]|nr:MAG: hypothetical protein E2P01_08345 [Acidobacteriota bacterium]